MMIEKKKKVKKELKNFPKRLPKMWNLSFMLRRQWKFS